MNRTCPAPSPSGATLTKADRERMLAEADPYIRAFVLKSGLPRDQRDDAMQEARLAVWESAAKFDPARGVKWVTYAVGITKRVILREYQAGAMGDRGRPAQMPDDADQWLLGRGDDERDGDGGDEEPDEDATPDALGEAVRRQLGEPLLAKLGDRSREIVELIAFEGLTPDQVAVRLDMKVKDVKLYVRNAAYTMTNDPKPKVKAARPRPRTERPAGGTDAPGRSAARLYAAFEARIAAAVTAHPDWTAGQLRQELGFPGAVRTLARYVGRVRAAQPASAGEPVAPPADQEPTPVTPPVPPVAPLPTPTPEPAKRVGTNGWNYWRRLVPGSARMLLANAVRDRRR